MVPGLRLVPEGEAAVNDHVTTGLATPATVAVNCNWVPMMAVAGLGLTVSTAPADAAGDADVPALLPPA